MHIKMVTDVGDVTKSFEHQLTCWMGLLHQRQTETLHSTAQLLSYL